MTRSVVRGSTPLRIECVGGGPAGLYFSILMRQAFGEVELTVRERNRPDDTFGWGVVFSDATLDNIRAADPESFEEIRASFAYWDDIETWYRGGWVRSTGHGFCGLSRKRLLEILQARARELGVELCFQQEVPAAELPRADLVVACDGIFSSIRERFAEQFKPRVEWGRARFCWLGTTLPLEAFTFVFLETEHGLFQVHAYPFERGERTLSTWIVECNEDVWRRAELDRADEAATIAYCERAFAEHLRGHPLLANRSIWRSFPTVSCERWSHENVVLLGDSAHSAHFSVGSGTKLAMEDAIALCDAFKHRGVGDVPRVLAEYEASRRVDVLKIQRAARTSQSWFEHPARYLGQPDWQFNFNLLTRSRRITWDNLAQRDPALIERVQSEFAAAAGLRVEPGKRAPEPMFTPLELRNLELSNRVVVSPMCQYSAVEGVPQEWHLVHLGGFAVGGAALVFGEATGVAPEGRITHGCTGIWNGAQEEAWKRIVAFVHRETSARIGLQIAHAGRKASCHLTWEGGAPLRGANAWQTIGPSPLPFDASWPIPREMNRRDMDAVRDAFVASAQRADRAGFDVVELHMAHGYLLSSFLSPLSNQRRDDYGGTRERRMRYPLEVFEAVRAALPAEKPLFVRLTGSDWLAEEGMTTDDAVAFARELRARGCDLVDVSSAGNSPRSKPDYGRLYQLPFAEQIRFEAAIPVMTVGGVQGADHVNTVLAAGLADLCAIARAHLVDPHLTLRAAVQYGYDLSSWPKQYLPAKPKPR